MRKGFSLQVLGYSLLFFLLSTITCTLYPIYAANSTPSADIQSKLNSLKTGIASKAAQLKTEVNKKLQNKAYVGIVKTKSATSLTLATKSSSKLITINQDTLYDGKIKSVKEEDYIAALGDVDESGVLTAKKIVILPQPKAGQPLAEKTIIWGQVISLSDNLATIKDRNSKTFSVSLRNIPATIKINDFVIMTALSGKDGQLEAKFVHLIPQGFAIKSKIKVATESASPSATPVSTKKK